MHARINVRTVIKLVVFLALKDIKKILLVSVKNVNKIIVKNVGLNNYFVLIVIHLVINMITIGHLLVQILQMVNVKLVQIVYVLTALII